MFLYHMQSNAISTDGREMPLMTIISFSLRYISEKAIEKLQEQVGRVVKTKIR